MNILDAVSHTVSKDQLRTFQQEKRKNIKKQTNKKNNNKTQCQQKWGSRGIVTWK